MARRPVDAPYTITTTFGEPDSYALFGYHSGVDYAVPPGRQVFAPASGQLTNVVSPTGGNMVVIYDGQFYHRLMHNQSFSRGNGPVSEGNEVARAGTTGLSTGPHVHWDININGNTARSFADFRDPAKWLAGEYKQAPSGGGEIMNSGDVTNMYRVLLGRDPDPSGLAAYTGRTWNDAFYSISGSQEFKNRQQANADLINGLRVALENEQKKPPKEVIKEVEKIVIQEVTKEVPVYTHDEETKQNVNKLVSMVTSIFDYFKGQYKSFSKYVKKEK